MARGDNAKNNKRPPVEYLNVDLNQARREELMKFVNEDRDWFDMVEKMCDSGLKIGLSFDSYNECMQASCTQIPDSAGGTTVVLIGRGGNLLQALQALMFKYHIILEGEMVDLDAKNGRGHTDWS